MRVPSAPWSAPRRPSPQPVSEPRGTVFRGSGVGPRRPMTAGSPEPALDRLPSRAFSGRFSRVSGVFSPERHRQPLHSPSAPPGRAAVVSPRPRRTLGEATAAPRAPRTRVSDAQPRARGARPGFCPRALRLQHCGPGPPQSAVPLPEDVPCPRPNRTRGDAWLTLSPLWLLSQHSVRTHIFESPDGLRCSERDSSPRRPRPPATGPLSSAARSAASCRRARPFSARQGPAHAPPPRRHRHWPRGSHLHRLWLDKPSARAPYQPPPCAFYKR